MSFTSFLFFTFFSGLALCERREINGVRKRLYSMKITKQR